MQAPPNASEITRETMRQLVVRRLSPTPDNYRAVFNEIAGLPDHPNRFNAQQIRSLLEKLPRSGAERMRLARELDQALAKEDAETAEQHLFAWLDTLAEDEPPAWNTLISNLIRQWEGRQLGWTPARKRESLQRVLTANEPATIYKRLQGLLKAWSAAPADPEVQSRNDASPDSGEQAESLDGVSPSGGADGHNATQASTSATFNPPDSPDRPPDADDLTASLRDLIGMVLDTALPALLTEHPDLTREATNLAANARTASSLEALQTLGVRIRKFAYRLEITSGETAEIRAGLLKLLQLLLENIDEIVLDDNWLQGQLETLREVVSRPANVRRIDEAEQRLKDVIFRQSQLKHNLAETQRSLREMLAGFLDQLANITESTGSYHDKIAAHASRIASANDINEISTVLDAVMRDTKHIQDETQQSRAELALARERAQQAENRIIQLQQELETVSREMRHDQLTGVLNRRGLEETFDKECARAKRHDRGLCVALLDIDNFKKINDTYGHKAGDDALVHLTSVVRDNLRPNDTVARLGGEEFIILYPDSSLKEATAALVRLQRQLTKTFFLTDGAKLLITFSAGVSPWQPGEPLEDVLKRADVAMYEAKHTGKNRVVARQAEDVA